MKRTIFKLVITALTLFMISACAGGSDNTSSSGGTADNDNSSEPAKQVTVWFDTQQSSITNWYQTIDSGTVISKPADPVLEGYKFLGWYDNNVNGNLWDFTAPVTKDITLYAAWEQINNGGSDNGNNSGNEDGNDSGSKPEVPVICTIKYDNSGLGSTVSYIELQSGTTLYNSHLPVLYADGYIFQGWYYNDIKINAGEFKVTESITLTAKWLIDNTEDSTAPAEVTDLKVYLENNIPVLSWVNPQDEDFNTVIITYYKNNSSTTLSGHKSSGAGNPDTFNFQKVMYDADKYTFTVQTIDYKGNTSKGESVRLDGKPVQPEPEPTPEPEPEPEPEPNPDFSKYKNQTVWFYGINGPKPDSADWVKHPEDYKVWELPWKAEYGWYDVNKTHLVDIERNNKVVAGDNELCWAATSSNILHWWFRLNADYIARYDKLHPEKAANRPSSKYPLAGTEHLGGSIYQESEIFQYYIDHFKDEAGWTDSGVNWYISGKKPTMPMMTNQEGGGFFDDVFPEGKFVATKVQGLSKNVFTSTIINAIEGHKMIGLSGKTTATSHLMTVWGAEFDEDGYVKAIYLADNNVEQTTVPYTKDLTRRLIQYGTYEGTSAGYTEMSTFWTTTYNAIVALITVDLGVKQWEEYLKEHEKAE